MVFGTVKAKLSQCETLAMAEGGIRKEEVFRLSASMKVLKYELGITKEDVIRL